MEIPSGTLIENPMTGNLTPAPPVVKQVAVSIQQRLLTGMTETGMTSVVDERVAIVLLEDSYALPPEIPADAVFFSPQGERWNAAGDGIIRRGAYRKAVYTSVSVRRAKEGDRG